MSSAAEDFRDSIHAELGTAPEWIEPGRLHRFSTSSRASDKAGWCQLFDDGRAGVFGDFRSGVSTVWVAKRREPMSVAERASMSRKLTEAKRQREALRKQKHSSNSTRNEDLWAQTLPVVPGDPVSLYLQQRGLDGPVPEHLRLHPCLTYWDDGNRGRYPAMVAPLVSPDGLVLALHRTYLTADGRKAPVPTVKKLTKASGSLSGTCIPLHEAQRGVIGIAEGIETAQAAHLASGLPTVAAYCASNLAAFLWPDAINRIVIFADADRAGADAAQCLKVRAMRAGINAVVLTPREIGTDWCDVWARRTLANASHVPGPTEAQV